MMGEDETLCIPPPVLPDVLPLIVLSAISGEERKSSMPPYHPPVLSAMVLFVIVAEEFSPQYIAPQCQSASFFVIVQFVIVRDER